MGLFGRNIAEVSKNTSMPVFFVKHIAKVQFDGPLVWQEGQSEFGNDIAFRIDFNSL